MKKVIILVCLAFTFSMVYPLEIHEAKFNLGKKLFDKKIYPEAVQEFADIVTNYPYSPYYYKSVCYAAKSYAALDQYDKALIYYKLQLNSSKTLADKRQAAFGTADCYYHMKRWQESAKAYMDYAAQNHDSPVYPAALYYAGRSLEELSLYPEASDIYQTLLAECSLNKYAAEANKRLALLKKSPVSQNAANENKAAVQTQNFSSSNSEQQLNVVELKDSGVASNCAVVVTNVIQITNQTGTSAEGDTNLIVGDPQKKQEEVDRYRALIELKARLLEIKEKALRNKTEFFSNLTN